MTPREIEEYRSLRATIRERGTQRVWIALSGLFAWAAMTILVAAFVPLPVAALVPLLVLATTFECVFAVHTAVERIGRYLQVFYEEGDDSQAKWEHQAMAYGRMFPGGGPDPLLVTSFSMAAIFNFIPVVLANAIPVEYIVVGSVHLLVLVRLFQARRQAGRQRAVDLERFQQLKSGRS